MVKFPGRVQPQIDPAETLTRMWCDEIDNAFYEIRKSMYGPGQCRDCGKVINPKYERCWYHHQLDKSLHYRPLNRYCD